MTLKSHPLTKVLHLWPAHYRRFSSFVTKLSEHDRDTLQIRDPKIMQSMINRVPREKAFQATAEEKVSHGQQAMHNGAIAEANLQR